MLIAISLYCCRTHAAVVLIVVVRCSTIAFIVSFDFIDVANFNFVAFIVFPMRFSVCGWGSRGVLAEKKSDIFYSQT